VGLLGTSQTHRLRVLAARPHDDVRRARFGLLGDLPRLRVTSHRGLANAAGISTSTIHQEREGKARPNSLHDTR
jgi:hypothetical protein